MRRLLATLEPFFEKVKLRLQPLKAGISKASRALSEVWVFARPWLALGLVQARKIPYSAVGGVLTLGVGVYVVLSFSAFLTLPRSIDLGVQSFSPGSPQTSMAFWSDSPTNPSGSGPSGFSLDTFGPALLGVVFHTENASASVALLKDNQEPLLLLKQGDTYENQASVSAIARNSISFLLPDGRSQTLYLPGTESSDEASGSDLIRRVAPESSAKKLSPEETSIVAHLTAHPEDINQYLSFRVEAEGVRILEVKPRAQALGLQKGDLIVRVNDRPILSLVGDGNAISDLQSLQSLQLEVERKGQSQLFRFDR